MNLLIVYPERFTQDEIRQFGSLLGTSVHLAVNLEDARRLIYSGIMDIVTSLLYSSGEFDLFTREFDIRLIPLWVIGVPVCEHRSIRTAPNLMLVNSNITLIREVKNQILKQEPLSQFDDDKKSTMFILAEPGVGQ